jgi:molecular chaperone DnaK
MTSPVLGIDLGTTNTVVAVCGRKGVTVLEDGDGETLTPSIVSFVPSGDILVGRAARERRLIDAKNTVFSTKRLIGRPFRTPEVRRAAERAPYALAESDNGGIEVRVRSERYSLPEVSAFVLRRARALAEDALGQICSHAVLTVPASFNELQRTATRDAGRIAGMHVLRILNEPTAAALAYGFGARNDRRIAVYDLGGGTFDLSILDLSGDVIEVIATAGDSYLGGDDVDTLIADRMAATFLAQHRVDLSSDPQGYERLRVAAEWLKVQLSTTERAHVRVEQAAYGAFGKAIDLEHSLTRAEHDQLVSPLIARTFDICDSAMRVANLRPTQVDEVILVGGQTIAPRVRDMVAEYFGRVPLTNVHPSHVVAEGASVLGYALTGGSTGARAPVRVRTAGRPDLTTLVPPAPSMPPPAPSPSLLPEAPQRSSSVPGVPSVTADSLRGTLPPPPLTPLPPPAPAPVFPGFDDDEPTRVADLPQMQEPRKQQRNQHSDPSELFTSSEDEPTEHMPPRQEPAPSAPALRPAAFAALRSASGAIAPLREDLPQVASEDRKSPTPRAPSVGVPLAAVSLRRSSPPPPAPATEIERLPMAPLPRVGSAPLPSVPSTPAPLSGAPNDTVPGVSYRTPSVRPQTAPPISLLEASAQVRAPGPLTSTKRHASPPPADGDEVALRISSLPPPPPPALSPPPPARRTPMPGPAPLPAARAPEPAPVPIPPRVLSPVPPPHSLPSTPPAVSVVMPATMKLPPPPVHAPAARPAPSAAPVARSQPAPTKTAKLPAVPSMPEPSPSRRQPISEPPPTIDIEEPIMRPPLLIDVTPHTLAVETAGGFCEPIVERNAPIPTEQTRRFSTSQDFQSSVRMRICQGEGRRVEQNQLLGTIELTELRAAARGAVKIEVTFVIDADGTLSVRARDDATGKSQRVRIDLLGGLSEESVTRMYKRQKSLTVRG